MGAKNLKGLTNGTFNVRGCEQVGHNHDSPRTGCCDFGKVVASDSSDTKNWDLRSNFALDLEDVLHADPWTTELRRRGKKWTETNVVKAI